MEYYVTLIKDDQNKHDKTSLRTSLREPLEFKQPYKVAVTDIIIKKPLEIQIGKVSMSLLNSNSIEKFFYIYASEGELVIDIFKRLDNEIKDYFIEKEYQKQMNKTSDWKISEKPKNKEDWYNYIKQNQNQYKHAYFYFSISNKIWFESDEKRQLKFYGQMKDLTERFWINSTELYIVSYDLTEKRVHIEEPYYIKTNIIDFQYFGSKCLPILACFSMNGKSHVQFVNPHYINVNHTNIFSISIEIIDANNNCIKTKNLNLSITLHFKPNGSICEFT